MDQIIKIYDTDRNLIGSAESSFVSSNFESITTTLYNVKIYLNCLSENYENYFLEMEGSPKFFIDIKDLVFPIVSGEIQEGPPELSNNFRYYYAVKLDVDTESYRLEDIRLKNDYLLIEKLILIEKNTAWSYTYPVCYYSYNTSYNYASSTTSAPVVYVVNYDESSSYRRF